MAEVAREWNLADLEWPLVQIVSELASNAVIHAGTDFTVCLDREGEAARIEVLDGSARRAHPRSYGADATNGRGLRLVERLAQDWGVSRTEQGKGVWAVVDSSALDERDPEALLEFFLQVERDNEQLGHGPTAASKDRRSRDPRARASLAA